ncbi:MAG TPA: hypothetical protein VE972_05180 [Conexibacter sp.]|nr:hypothetical protein [Conexibacter sp.]
MFVVIVAMALLGAGIAQAEPVQQFSFQVTGSHPEDLTVRLHLRRFDTTGAVPPTPTAFELRLPAGVRLNPAFLTARYRCDGGALRSALDARPTGVPFDVRLAHLGVFARELARSHAKRDHVALVNVRTCMRARLGSGTGLVDARAAVSVLTDPVPFRFSLFLSAGTIPGAVAGLAALGAADPRSAIVHRYPVVAGVHALERENFLSDPSPDGLYGLKLAIYTGPINGFHVSRAQVDATVHTLTIRRGTCLARGRGGRCVRRQRADASLFTLPSCSASKHYSVQLFAAYPRPTPSATTTSEVPCPGYMR